MKTRFVAGIFVLMLVLAPVASSALTADDVQAKIQALLAQVASLTAQIRALQGQADSGDAASIPSTNAGYKHRVCSILARNLSEGTSGDDVRGLQEFLQEEGYLAVAPTGYFGALTRDALQKWQASQGIVSSGSAATTGWGVLGPKTMERIRVWCGGGGGGNSERFDVSPTSGSAPLTVTFRTWLPGFRASSISYAIDYGDGTSEAATNCNAPADACIAPGENRHTYTENGIYTATLNKITDPCPDDGDPNTPRCMAAIHREVIAKAQIYVGTTQTCTKEYKPVCGSKQVQCITTPCNPVQQTYSNRCMMEADGATFLYEGQCRTATSDPSLDPQCKSWFDGCNSCSRQTPGGIAACTLRYCPAGNTPAYCISYFGDANNNGAPTISGFSGPTTLRVDENGTWTVRASDPEGQELSYYVSWGDEGQTAQGLRSSLPVFTQTATFTHSYSAAGTYLVQVTARDAAGKESSASITVQVSGSSTVCTEEYAPVCGRPPGCKSCAEMGYTEACPAICALKDPQTYSNRCTLNAAGATFMYAGSCTY